MRIIKKVLQYILALILALSILILIFINIFSSSILSETYVLNKLDEANYYSKIKENVESNFENYIYQSGLDEEVLKDIVSTEKIKKDTQIILENIYDGMKQEIDTAEISEKLNQNIKNSVTENVIDKQKKQIETFVNTICNEYGKTITHTKYEENINKIYQNITKYKGILNKISLITIAVCTVGILLLTVKRPYKAISKYGVAFCIDGFILLFIRNYITSKIQIEGFTMLNDAFSEVIKNTLIEIMSKIMLYGWVFSIIGIATIIIGAIIKAIRKHKREIEKYTPEI